jgi:sugar O-acyltransferase (sialic acid O-acetyltransferase NeuD family)
MNRASSAPVFELVGVIDDGPSPISLKRLAERRVHWIGTVDEWLSNPGGECYLIAIGNPATRAQIHSKLRTKGTRAALAVHPHATVGSMSRIGEGTIICSGAEISTNVSLGKHVHINPNATIGHDVSIDDCSSINPASIISGDVRIGHQALVGAGAVVLQGRHLGNGCVVGAASCVTHDVAAGITVKGVPAR